MSTLIPRFSVATPTDAFTVGAPVFGAPLDAIGRRINHLLGRRHLRTFAYAIRPFSNIRFDILGNEVGGEPYSETFVVPITTSALANRLVPFVGCATVVNTSSVSVVVREAPAVDVDGFGAALSGAVVDPGFEAVGAPFWHIRGGFDRDRWVAGASVPWAAGSVDVATVPEESTDGLRLLHVPPASDLELAITVIDTELVSITFAEAIR